MRRREQEKDKENEREDKPQFTSSCCQGRHQNWMLLQKTSKNTQKAMAQIPGLVQRLEDLQYKLFLHSTLALFLLFLLRKSSGLRSGGMGPQINMAPWTPALCNPLPLRSNSQPWSERMDDASRGQTASGYPAPLLGAHSKMTAMK